MTTPALITTAPQRLSKATLRECTLVQKRHTTGLSAEEQAELAAIYAALPVEETRLTTDEVDQLARDRSEEARLLPQGRCNFHD